MPAAQSAEGFHRLKTGVTTVHSINSWAILARRCFACYTAPVEPSFELFDHTADIGLRIQAPTLPELLQPAADALYAVIGKPAVTDDAGKMSFDLRADDSALLLRDFLARLLVLFECEARVIRSLEVHTFNEHRLIATAQTALVDYDHSIFSHEAKAITYHELSIRSSPDGLVATVIVDI